MEDLITWLRQQFNDDEKTAKAATPGPWWVHRQGLEAVVSPSVAMDREEGGVSIEDASHIARHDPAAVLADVAAKRAVLLLCSASLVGTSATSPSSFIRGQDDGYREAMTEAVRYLARAYRHRPGWRTEWE